MTNFEEFVNEIRNSEKKPISSSKRKEWHRVMKIQKLETVDDESELQSSKTKCRISKLGASIADLARHHQYHTVESQKFVNAASWNFLQIYIVDVNSKLWSYEGSAKSFTCKYEKALHSKIGPASNILQFAKCQLGSYFSSSFRRFFNVRTWRPKLPIYRVIIVVLIRSRVWAVEERVKYKN